MKNLDDVFSLLEMILEELKSLRHETSPEREARYIEEKFSKEPGILKNYVCEGDVFRFRVTATSEFEAAVISLIRISKSPAYPQAVACGEYRAIFPGDDDSVEIPLFFKIREEKLEL